MAKMINCDKCGAPNPFYRSACYRCGSGLPAPLCAPVQPQAPAPARAHVSSRAAWCAWAVIFLVVYASLLLLTRPVPPALTVRQVTAECDRWNHQTVTVSGVIFDEGPGGYTIRDTDADMLTALSQAALRYLVADEKRVYMSVTPRFEGIYLFDAVQVTGEYEAFKNLLHARSVRRK